MPRSSFSSWFDMDIGVPQASILGLLLFNIITQYLFLNLVKSDVYNLADDNTLYSFGNKLENVLSIPKYDLKNCL